MQGEDPDATTERHRNFRRNRPLHLIMLAYFFIWLLTALTARDGFDWFLENVLVFVGVSVLFVSYKKLPLSNLSYLLIAIFLSFHAVGSNATYSESLPGTWMQQLFGWERNHYDRVVHFLFGFLLATPLWEVLTQGAGVARRWLSVLCVAIVLAMSNLYEIIEWGAAEIIDPEAGIAFLGTQGDVFDAQKDSGLALLGVLLGLSLSGLFDRLRPLIAPSRATDPEA